LLIKDCAYYCGIEVDFGKYQPCGLQVKATLFEYSSFATPVQALCDWQLYLALLTVYR